MPQGTSLGLAQAPQQTRSVGSVVPGGLVQIPVAHMVPAPVQVRQLAPVPST